MASILLPTMPLPSRTPSIQTERLVLRAFKRSNLPALHQLRTILDVMRWTSQGTVDSSEDESSAWLEQFIYDDDQTERRNYNFVVLKKPNPSTTPSDAVYEKQEVDDSTFIGVLGIHQFDPLGLPRLGYMFLPEAWGKGYATEALGGFQKAWWDLPRDDPMVFSLRGLTKELRPGSIRAFTNKSNMPSAAVLRKNGWVAEKESQNGDKVIVSWIIRGPVDD